MAEDILGSDLLLRLGVDASGLTTELSAKLTAAEREAVSSGNKISAAYGAGADKAVAAQLRVVAATERANKVLQSEKATLGQRASAQASVISAQQRYTTELAKSERATTTLATAERSRFSGIARGLAAGAGFAGAQGLVSLVSEAKNAAVDYQDVVSANAVTFGKQRKQIDDFKTLQADALNLSKLQTETLANTFGSVFKTAGSSQADAVSQGLDLAQRAADVRSFRGGQLTDVADAFRSALVGETEPIRRYGVLLDDARLKLRALDLGLIDTTKGTLPPAVKAQAAYAEILAQTADAQGDVSRTADSAANKIEDQRQKAADAKNELGTGLLPVISELATAGSELAPALAGVARGIGAILGNDMARRSIELGVAAAAVLKLGSGLNGLINNAQAKIQANLLLAKSYDQVAGSAVRAGVAERSAAGVGGAAKRGGRGQLVGLGGLGLALGATGAVGAATGSGDASMLSNIISGGLAGAGVGSFFPGAGTLIGAGIGAAAGAGLSIFGPSGPGATTNRTPEQIKADLRGVTAEMEKLKRAGSPDNATRGFQLQSRQAALSKELEASRKQAKQTFATFDAGTGQVKQLTQAQIAAAGASEAHTKALQKERDEFDRLRDSFAVDPFSGKPDTKKAVSAGDALKRIRGTVDTQRQLRRDLARLAARGASQEQLQALYSLDQTAPGTVHRIASTNAGKYAKEFDRALRELKHNQTAFAKLFDGTDTLAAEKGKRDARAYRRAYAREMAKRLKGLDPAAYFGAAPESHGALPPGATLPAKVTSANWPTS